MDTGMPMGAPPSGPPPMGPPPGGPPDAKRQRREGLVLEPEEEFLQKYPGPSKMSLCAKIACWLRMTGLHAHLMAAALQ